MDDAEPTRFIGGITATGRIEGHIGWRGPGRVTVCREGIEFCMATVLGRYVQKGEISRVYPVKARRLSVTGIIASVIPRLPSTAVRFVTQPVGVTADRDDYLFFSYRHEEWKMIDVLEGLGYPVSREPRTLRFYWEDEVGRDVRASAVHNRSLDRN
jgi:hypothetical protein